MSFDISYIDRSEGAKLLVEYCEDIADQLNIELIKNPYWVLPILEPAIVCESCDLIIETTLGSIRVTFSREELDNYPDTIGN